MNFKVEITPIKGQYHTREELYALCVLLCWPEGLTLSNNVADNDTVTLIGIKGGNPGLSTYVLQNNPNATDVKLTAPAGSSYEPIFFKVLGINLEVQFDEDGVGVVNFPHMPIAESV